KTAPRGYAKDHVAVDLLRHKSLVVSHKFRDAEISADSFLPQAIKVFQAMQPLVQFLNKAIAETIE
ncbi:MAG TPA: DUF2461 family protein, partial [Bacteroidetes bacterium]|nr:DUF2461 family protein [Bacteroidota bacterium]